MYYRERLLLPILLSVVTACASDAQPVSVQPLPEAQMVRSYSGMTTRQRLVVRDDATWADLWKEIASPFQPAPPVPAVDFAENMLIVAAMGAKATGGYSISVDEVRIVDGDVRISVTEESPGTGCFVTEAETAPVAVVVAPQFAGQATFLEHASQHACR